MDINRAFEHLFEKLDLWLDRFNRDVTQSLTCLTCSCFGAYPKESGTKPVKGYANFFRLW